VAQGAEEPARVDARSPRRRSWHDPRQHLALIWSIAAAVVAVVLSVAGCQYAWWRGQANAYRDVLRESERMFDRAEKLSATPAPGR
jgi:hypothetical protein